MNAIDLPTSPNGSRFGWPKPARLEEFSKLLNAEELPTHRIVFKGQPKDIPIIRVPIGLPKYRMGNGRTASLQVEHLAKNPDLRKDLFSGDPELWDAQEEQHRLLVQLGRQADLAKYFEDVSNKQVGPILLDENGFVVNGNRRLSTWRELLAKERSRYGHFGDIDVVVLPHCTDREIDRIEAMLQIEKDIRADYNWDAHANMMSTKMSKEGFTPTELAELYRMKENQVEELLDMRDYASEYLNSRGKPDLWSQVSPHEFAFRRLVQWRSKVTGVARQEMFKEAAFALIDDPSSVGRLYEAIPALAENIEQISVQLAAQFPVAPKETSNELEALFGGAVAADQPAEGGLIAVLQDETTRKKARDVIADVLEAQRQLKKDRKAEGYLLETCAKANAALEAAVKDGLRAESKPTGVAKQLDAIEAHVFKIRKFLTQNA